MMTFAGFGGAAIFLYVGAEVSIGTQMALFAVLAARMCLFVFAVGGVPGGFVALAIGLFNSIMFSVIFTLTLERSTASEQATSGMLCTAIIGGAFVPLLAGAVSDAQGYVFAFIVPALCYLLLTGFAVGAGRSAPIASGKSAAAGAAGH